MSKPTLYKQKTSARAAALKALGKGAEFEIVATDDGRFYWIDTSAAAALAAGAENDPVPTHAAPEPEVSLSDTPEGCIPMAAGVDVVNLTSDPVEVLYSDGSTAIIQPEPFEEEEPEAKADLTIDLGLTPELVALIYGLGEAAGAAIPVPQKRKGLTAEAWEAVHAGRLPEPLKFPASNAHAQKHADALLAIANMGDEAGLHAYQIGGTNTYSKALRDYRDALLVYVSAKITMKEAA